MATEIDTINKVVITEEAEFDYESLVELPLPKTDIKSEAETYIDYLQEDRKLNGYYFRVKYYDEQSEQMLMLFIYKGERFGKMQTWKVEGICFANDWSEELEECGQVRFWLKSSINPQETGDWVWDLRIKEEKRRREMEEYEGVKTVSMVKELLKGYKLNKSKISIGVETPEVQDLKEKMEFLDVCIEQLDEEEKAIITEHFIKGKSLAVVGKKFGYAKTGCQYKRDRAVAILEILFQQKYA